MFIMRLFRFTYGCKRERYNESENARARQERTRTQRNEKAKVTEAERKSERAVSEPLTLQIVSELLRSDAVSQSGWVLDGYPRSIDQVTYVSLMTRVTYVSPVDGYPRATDQAQALKQAGVPLRRLVTVGISDEALVRRAVGRRIDPVTHTLYHLEGIGFPAPPDDDEVSDLVSLML